LGINARRCSSWRLIASDLSNLSLLRLTNMKSAIAAFRWYLVALVVLALCARFPAAMADEPKAPPDADPTPKKDTKTNKWDVANPPGAGTASTALIDVT